jgi:uncharacterized protein (DUF2141 family)
MISLKKQLYVHAFFFCALGFLGAQEKGSLTLEITGARSDDGVIRILVFAGEKGFPNDHTRAVAGKEAVTLKNGRVTVTLPGVPLGELAVVIFHDEDGDGEMDTNFIGIPTEGLGVSNNPDLKGPPKFKDASFFMSGKEMTIPVDVKYIFKKKGT